MFIPNRGPVTPWTRQPPPGTPVFVGAGITDRMTFLWDPNGGNWRIPQFFKYHPTEEFTPSTNHPLGVYQHRTGRGIFIAHTHYMQTSTTPVAVVKTSDGAGTGDYTFMSFAKPWNGAVARVSFGQRESSVTFRQTYIAFNMSDAYGNQAGAVGLMTYGSGASNLVVTGQQDSKWHVWIGTRKGDVLSMYKDGRLIGSASKTLRNVLATANQGVTIGCAWNAQFAGGGYDQGICAAWDRALTAGEIRAIGQNPWMVYG